MTTRIVILSWVAALAVASCAPVAPVAPVVIRADHGRATGAIPRRLLVVSYNVEFGEEPGRLAEQLAGADLDDLDVLVLQEIEGRCQDPCRRATDHEAQAIDLARALDLNAVYVPTYALDGGRRTHGVAVLSRWPIVDQLAIPLPTIDAWFARPRMAVGVILQVAGSQVQVWTAHLDTQSLPLDRLRQLEAILRHAAAIPGMAIVAGDFNTWNREHETAVEALARAYDFDTPTTESGATFPAQLWTPNPPMRLDHIFTRGLRVTTAGVAHRVRGSDHRPLWVEAELPRPPRSRLSMR